MAIGAAQQLERDDEQPSNNKYWSAVPPMAIGAAQQLKKEILSSLSIVKYWSAVLPIAIGVAQQLEGFLSTKF
jgi:hypothetical protein